jgi:error-prone DNA polymerase
VVSAAQLRGGEKGRPVYDVDELVGHTAGHVLALTGCRKGAVRQALRAAAIPRRRAARLREWFGADNVAVELTHAGLPTTPSATTRWPRSPPTRACPRSSPPRRTTPRRAGSPRHGAGRGARPAQPRRRRRLAPPAGTAHLRSGAELTDRFEHRHPGAVARAAAFGRECAFSIRLVAPNLPPFPVPPGETEVSWLRELTWRGVAKRYGSHAEYPRPST